MPLSESGWPNVRGVALIVSFEGLLKCGRPAPDYYELNSSVVMARMLEATAALRWTQVNGAYQLIDYRNLKGA